MIYETLTPQQMAHTESRVLHDAELLRGGARINNVGVLTVTFAQIESLSLTESISPAWLQKPVEDLLVGSSRQTRIANTLRWNGFHNAGDIVCAGKERLLNIRNFGQTALRDVEQALSNEGHVLFDKPQPEDLTQLYERAEDVSSAALHEDMYSIGGFILGEIFSMSADELKRRLPSHMYAGWRSQKASAMKIAATKFKLRFDAAKQVQSIRNFRKSVADPQAPGQA